MNSKQRFAYFIAMLVSLLLLQACCCLDKYSNTKIARRTFIDDMGKHIPGKILVSRFDGTQERELVSNLAPQLPFGRTKIAWSPDGSQIAYETKLPDQTRPNTQIAIVDASDGRIVRVPNPPGVFQAHNPSWNKSGTKLAFIAKNEKGSSVEYSVYIADLVVPRVVPLGGTKDARSVAWSSTGAIAYGVRHRVYITDESGSEPTLLWANPVSSAHLEEMEWSPNGRYLVLDNVTVIDEDGERVQDLGWPFPILRGRDAHWSPDSKFLIYQVYKGWVVFAAHSNGSCKQKVPGIRRSHAMDWTGGPTP